MRVSAAVTLPKTTDAPHHKAFKAYGTREVRLTRSNHSDAGQTATTNKLSAATTLALAAARCTPIHRVVGLANGHDLTGSGLQTEPELTLSLIHI